jgi:IclR family transcriptional regulator, KDG regulon repressor
LSEDRYIMNSVLRTAEILKSFTREKTAFTNSELSKKLGLNRSTITRLLYSLEKAGFLVRDDRTKAYALSYWLYRIGNVYISQIDLHKEAMPLLSQLSQSCKEAVHLAVLRDFQVFYLNKVEGPQPVRIASAIGDTNPAYCTGVGKVLLAYLNEKELDAYLQSVKLKRFTPNTICSPEDLKRHLKQIITKGYAIDDCEHETEVRCIAAPLRDITGQVIASISLSGPEFRMFWEKIREEFIPAVRETAAKISRRLGYSG